MAPENDRFLYQDLTMKRTIECSFFAAVLFLVGCNRSFQSESEVTFVTELSPIEFTFPRGWKPNRADHPFDLQCFSRAEDMTTGVFVFTHEDLAEGSDPQDILASQINDLRGKRENFKEFEAKISTSDEVRSITTETFSGEKGVSKNIYRFSLVEFADDPDVFAVVLQTSVPSVYRSKKADLAGIVGSARSLGGEGQAQESDAPGSAQP